MYITYVWMTIATTYVRTYTNAEFCYSPHHTYIHTYIHSTSLPAFFAEWEQKIHKANPRLPHYLQYIKYYTAVTCKREHKNAARAWKTQKWKKKGKGSSHQSFIHAVGLTAWLTDAVFLSAVISAPFHPLQKHSPLPPKKERTHLLLLPDQTVVPFFCHPTKRKQSKH